MERAQLYAINRVICGHHWKSDIDASLLLASAMFAKVVSTEGYQEQLKKARAEYKQVTENDPSKIEGITANQQSAAIYDLQGRRIDSAPQPGIYIQDGRKTVVK